MNPCGTPQIISRQFLDTFWEDIYCFLSLRYVMDHSNAVTSFP